MDPVVAKIAEQFKVVHGNLRNVVRGHSVDELNWKPAPETNSIAALIVPTSDVPVPAIVNVLPAAVTSRLARSS